MTDKAGEFLFVYGTLRRDIAKAIHPLLGELAEFVDWGTTTGRLYDLGDYPALVLDNDEERVAGEVYRMHDPAVWQRLDAHEEGYRRERVAVLLHRGDVVATWAYVYAGTLDGARHIRNGDYAAYCGGGQRLNEIRQGG